MLCTPGNRVVIILVSDITYSITSALNNFGTDPTITITKNIYYYNFHYIYFDLHDQR